MWKNEFESGFDGPNGRIFFEPIETDAPETSQPYCCYIGTVIFYARPGSLEIVDRAETQWDLFGKRFCDIAGLAGVAPFVEHDGVLYELITGRVRWITDKWFMLWIARKVAGDDMRLQLLEETTNET